MRERQRRWHLSGAEWALIIFAGWAILAYSAA